jgi:orotidine-5'-phosphate decarboxylase
VSIHFADRLLTAVKEKKSVAVVGIDPQLEMLPPELQEFAADFGERQKVLEIFGKGIIDAVAEVVPAVKPNIAFFETFGLAGLAAYVTICAHAYKQGLIVIGDVKRGDIASTARAYAAGLLRPLPPPTARADNPFQLGPHHAITVNPYLGNDGVAPFAQMASENGQGIFALVKTSNPTSREIQDLPLAAGGTVAEAVADLVRRWGEANIGDAGFSNVGAVVGATHPEQLACFRELMPAAFFLLPGYGAQGGTAAGLKPAFRADGAGAVVNASRSVIYAWRDYPNLTWTAAARAAAIKMNADLNSINN